MDFDKLLAVNTHKDKIREQAKEILKTYQDFPEIENYQAIKAFDNSIAVFGDVSPVEF